MNCSHGGCHDGRNVARYYRPAPNSRTAELCADCVRRMNALTETWRLDRRVKDDPHVPQWEERRRTIKGRRVA